jgi:hypothetical protein
MVEDIEARTTTIETVDLTKPLGEPSKLPFNFLLGAQRFLCEEIRFVSDEMLDRAQTETHLFNEFLSKMAEAHSVNDIMMMYEVCGQHQMDFIERGWVGIFKHARRLIDFGHGTVKSPNEDRRTRQSPSISRPFDEQLSRQTCRVREGPKLRPD